MRLPTINQRIMLRIPSGSWKGRYSAYMEAVESATIKIAHPMFGSGLVPLFPGDDVVVEYLQDGERLAFDAKVVGRDLQQVAMLILTRPETKGIYRQQLRDFVRLEVNLPLEYVLSSHAQEPNPDPDSNAGSKLAPSQEQKPLAEGRTVDLSGGGAQIITQEAFRVGSKLDLVLHLPKQVVFAEAEVVRQIGHDTPDEFSLGVRFTAIEEREREHIVRYIFSEQRRRRQKGLI